MSVGQDVHEGEALDLSIDVVNRHFGSLAFYEPALKVGEPWLSRHAATYQRLQGLSQILPWDHWLSHPEFKIQAQGLRTQLKQDPAYRESIYQTIKTFLNRYDRPLTPQSAFDYQRAQGLCLEECTVLCLWAQLQCQFEVYRSPHHQAITDTYQNWVLPQYPDLLHPIALQFKHRKLFKAQCMES